MLDLKSVLKKHPDCLSSRATFKAVLADSYPTEKRLINMLTILYECGIAVKIANKRKNSSDITENEYQNILTQLENDYGIIPKYSCEAVHIWAEAFGVKIQAITSPVVPPLIYEPIIHAPIVEKVVAGCKSDYETETINTGELLIKKFIGFDEKELIVPNQIDGIPVKIIGEYAFENCAGIERIIISEGITEIENGAFCGCSSLTTVVLPSSLKMLGNKPNVKPAMYSWQGPREIPFLGVFEKCAIKTINLPAGLNFLGPRAFRDCTKLERIDLPNGIEKILSNTFNGCKEMKQVICPDNLTKIGNSAFCNCGLETIDIPPTVTEIEDSAFNGCKSLRQITLHEGLLKIGDATFENCKELCEITIPKSVTSIGKNVFDITGWHQPYDLRRKGYSTREKSKDLVIACYAGSYGLEYARKEGYQIKNAAK